MRSSYHSEQWLPHPPELVFAFLSNPENRPRLMPRWQRARIEEATIVPPPPRLDAQPALSGTARKRTTIFTAGTGSRLTLSFRPFPYSPLRVAWEAEITEFVWNRRLCYRQLRGPCAYWNHLRSIEPQARQTETGEVEQGTLLRDEIEYELPLGALGQLAQRLFVERRLRAAFEFRHQRTCELLALMVVTNARLGLS